MSRALIFLILFSLSACSSGPGLSDRALSSQEAKAWLLQYCSKTAPLDSVQGEMIMRANTPEFKGQFPASVNVEKNGKFVIEVTNIVGGTMAQILGDLQLIEVKSLSKPKYNRRGVTHYLGIPAKVLGQLVRGELPCPIESDWKTVRVEGANIKIDTGSQQWTFYRLAPDSSSHQEFPAKITIQPQKLEFLIEEWALDSHFAKKVKVKSEAGDLKWSWRSRELR